MMQYGLFPVTACAIAVILALQLPAILHELNERKRISQNKQSD